MERKLKADLTDRSRDEIRLMEAKEMERKLKRKLKYVPVPNGYALSAKPEKFESYGNTGIRVEVRGSALSKSNRAG